MSYVPRVNHIVGASNWYGQRPGVVTVNFDPTDGDYGEFVANLADGTLIIQYASPGEDCDQECAVAFFIKACSECDTPVVSGLLSTAENTVAAGGMGRLSQRLVKADFADVAATGTAVLSGTIPAGAYVVRTVLTDVVAFSGDVSAVVTIGDGVDVDRYNTGTPSVFTSAAALDVGVPSGTAVHAVAEDGVTVIVTTAADFTAVSALAAMTVNIYYLLP